MRTGKVREARRCEAVSTPFVRGQLQPPGAVFAQKGCIVCRFKGGATIPPVTEWATGEDARTINVHLLIHLVEGNEGFTPIFREDLTYRRWFRE